MNLGAASSDQDTGLVSLGQEYVCGRALNLYKTDALEGLVTQATVGRHGRVVEASPQGYALILCEDDYPGWISAADGDALELAERPYQPVSLDRSAIEPRLSEVIVFTQRAMAVPNTYLWGGTVGPNYDCSGLMQAAFASVGIRLPRDSYQQEAFTQPIGWDELLPGDLIFFGTPERTKHVALYLGQGDYIHSSGVDQGRNGIGIDSLTDLSHPVSAAYHRQLRRAGRVMSSYCPGGTL
ncbi:C40 family peptidase [Phormidium tenue]|uniref:Glycoside hydrolase n=1 Tax=Phormidium tenue NIES-30 TaxID=549789 RepID=A0A1U7J6G9_9CYAN|nr:C40 family peptidase [Phormidium tenue]MBD2231913.1 C40 family peptidase [Phormidium tenue FACHB-1052]OKH48477.1 glycoside hydrolase [Phormidium tenue NIES-30]